MAMKTITFSCETITPMFLSGADGSTPELRPPSIKGALRFWWRAMNGGDYKVLKNREDEIFGSTKLKSKLLISTTHKNFKTSSVDLSGRMIPVKDKTFSIDILGYLLYGIYEKPHKQTPFMNRDYIEVEEKFTVDFCLNLADDIIQQIIEAFFCVSYFGGLGAKSRNGFGRFCIEKFEINDSIQKKPNYQNLFDKYFNKSQTSFSAFSQSSILFETIENKSSNYKTVLNNLGIMYRDAKLSLEAKHLYNERQFIVAPIIVEGEGQKSLLDRHSKPYFLSVIKHKNGEYQGIILFLSYDYCKDIDISEIGSNTVSDLQEEFKRVTTKFNNYLLYSFSDSLQKYTPTIKETI
jgi:CRISPR-associated protein Cmr1